MGGFKHNHDYNDLFLTWSQVLLWQFKNFGLSLLLVAVAGGQTGLPVPPVSTVGVGLLTLVARDVEADIEMAVAGDLIVTNLMICQY